MLDYIWTLAASGDLTLMNGTILACCALAVAFFPLSRTLFSLGSGAIFGLTALFITVPFALIGSVLAFLLSRYVLRNAAWRVVRRHPLLRLVMDSIEAERWKIVLLVRLGPPIPNFVQNYFFGTTKVTLRDYCVGTFFGVSTLVTLYTYLGAAGIDLVRSNSPISRTLIAASISAALLCVVLITVRVRKMLKARIHTLE